MTDILFGVSLFFGVIVTGFAVNRLGHLSASRGGLWAAISKVVLTVLILAVLVAFFIEVGPFSIVLHVEGRKITRLEVTRWPSTGSVKIDKIHDGRIYLHDQGKREFWAVLPAAISDGQLRLSLTSENRVLFGWFYLAARIGVRTYALLTPERFVSAVASVFAIFLVFFSGVENSLAFFFIKPDD